MVANVVIASVPRPRLDGCRPLRGQDRVVGLTTMDSANAAVAALPAKYRGRRRPRQWFAAERNVLAGEHSYDDAGEVPDRQSIANLELWWNGRLDVADAAHGVHPSSFSASVSPSGTSAVASSIIGAAAIIRCSRAASRQPQPVGALRVVTCCLVIRTAVTILRDVAVR
jgi:hypothetical protein